MITRRSKILEKLVTLSNQLEIINNNSEGLRKEVGERYSKKIEDIRKGISYFGDFAYVRKVSDEILGVVDVNRIQEFIKSYKSKRD